MMKTYLSLLRGINVTGHNSIKMAELRSLYESLGFENVRSYIQSGNVLFQTKKQSDKSLEEKISLEIKRAFGHEVSVLILNRERLADAIEKNPFAGKKHIDTKHLHFTFLKSDPDVSAMKEIEARKLDSEEIALIGNVLYLHFPKGYGNTKLNNTFLERKFKVVTTTRNWRTTHKLLDMFEEMEN